MAIELSPIGAGAGRAAGLAAGDAALVAAFHGGVYRDAFPDQAEPLDAWLGALRGEAPYEMGLHLALDGGALAGGIAYERYPRSRCGLATYLAVAPAARRAGLGRRLLDAAVTALHAGGAALVLGEVRDPRRPLPEPADVAWARLARFQRWGARVLGARYVQPALGPGLSRDRDLALVAFAGAAPLPAALDGAVVRAFVEELYEVTEGGAPDPEHAVPARVPLLELRS